jgi:hypothetical protein
MKLTFLILYLWIFLSLVTYHGLPYMCQLHTTLVQTHFHRGVSWQLLRTCRFLACLQITGVALCVIHLSFFYDTTALFTSKSLILLHFLSETLESPFWLFWINFLSGLICWANLENESPPLYKSHEICILYWPLEKESYLVPGKESRICNSPSIA